MKSHVTVVGILHIGMGAIGLIGGVIVFLVLGWVSTYVEEPDVEFLLPTLAVLIGGVIAIFSALEIIGGIGVLGYRNWARILVLVLSAIQLINIPIGTAIGIYSIVIMVHADTTPLFEARPYSFPPMSTPPAPPA